MSKQSFDVASNNEQFRDDIPEPRITWYAGADDPQIQADLETAARLSAAFVEEYKGRIGGLDAAGMLGFMKKMDADSVVAYKIGGYLSYLTSKDIKKYAALASAVDQKMTELAAQETFVSLELAQIPQQKIQDMIRQEPELELYRTILESAVKWQPYLMSEQAEIVSTKKTLSGRSEIVNIFDKMSAREKYGYEGKKLSQEALLKLRSEPDRNIRRNATASLYRGLKETLWLRSSVMNAVSLDMTVDQGLRGMQDPVLKRHMGNNIDGAIVEAMNAAIRNAYPRTSHRFYEMLRKQLDLPYLEGCDRNAPFGVKTDRKIPFSHARKTVLDSFHAFHPRMGELAAEVFDNGWIDAAPASGKSPGAWAMFEAIGLHPIMYMNYLGTPHDVKTLAHEMGHMVHHRLGANRLKSQSVGHAPLTVAETASIFGERLVLEKMLAEEKDPRARISLLSAALTDSMNSVVRQNAFFTFEKEYHARGKREGRPLTEKEGKDLYREIQTEALGPSFRLKNGYGLEWSYVPHFIHTPYYVYAYSFGNILVNSLYRKYQEADDKQAFAEKYIRLLEAGGSKSAEELVREFNLDLRDPGFWDGGMKTIEDLADRLQAELDALRPSAPPQSPKAP
ncbi:MAG: hypothetical protein HY370_05430 [Proteobacteria bacterium]|nr:hypothetical protein [Pseudomonadota bacterium]